MRFLFTIGLTIFLSTTVFGTAQFPDIIIYKGKKYDLHTNPLEIYFEKYPNRRPRGTDCTALWRGYIATFEIKDSQLYLKDIVIEVGNEYPPIRKSVFPFIKLVKVDWFTGLLVLPYGKIVNYVHMGVSTYEHYILLEIHNGNLTKEKQFDYREYEEFKEKQFEAF